MEREKCRGNFAKKKMVQGTKLLGYRSGWGIFLGHFVHVPLVKNSG